MFKNTLQLKGFKPALRILLALVIISLVLTPQRGALAASSCQCIQYIKNRFGLTGNGANAKDFGPYLQKRGFTQVSDPQVGAVAVMQPAFGQRVSSLGHVSVITAVKSSGKYWQITTIGANQSQVKTTQYNCTNVGTVKWGLYLKTWGAGYITYWVPAK